MKYRGIVLAILELALKGADDPVARILKVLGSIHNAMNDKPKSKKTQHTETKKTAPKTQGEKFYQEREVHLKEAYADFLRWSVLTKDEIKRDDEVRTQGEFAKKWNIAPDTIVDWKKRTDYGPKRSAAFKEKLSKETPEVLQDLRKRIKKYGSAIDVELYLAYAENWDKKQVVEFKPPVQFHENDVRLLIKKLPPDKQKLYYVTIAKLLADARSADAGL